jgi:2-polyprenyl-6-methoxyphenol hydroxylase-like FAD-dependent oxidoreductase
VSGRGQRRALIVGGSLAGLFAAHLLRAAGWDASIYERSSEELASRGAGIGTHEALFAVMRRIGLSIDDTIGVLTRTYVCLDRDGRVIEEIPQPRLMSAWARVYRLLKDSLAAGVYHGGRDVVRVETGGNRAVAVFADGARLAADLVVGADGVRSTVRSQLLARLEPAYAGYVAWRAVVAEGAVAPQTRALFDERYPFCLPPGEIALCYAVPGRDGDTRPGRRDYNLVWYRPADEAALARLCTDATGRLHAGSIPPPLIRPEVVADMRASAHALLAPAIADIIARTEQPFFQPIYDLASPRLVFGRVALLGDAAFVARPHVGAGVTKAALDAACLADALSEAGSDVGAALARYESERRAFGDWMVARSRHLGAWIGAAAAAGAQSQAERDRRSVAVMREYLATAVDIARFTAGGSAVAPGEVSPAPPG